MCHLQIGDDLCGERVPIACTFIRPFAIPWDKSLLSQSTIMIKRIRERVLSRSPSLKPLVEIILPRGLPSCTKASLQKLHWGSPNHPNQKAFSKSSFKIRPFHLVNLQSSRRFDLIKHLLQKKWVYQNTA